MDELTTIAIFTGLQRSEAYLLKSRLEAENIVCVFTGDNPSSEASDIRIQVQRSDAEKAHEIIHHLESFNEKPEPSTDQEGHPIIRWADRVLSPMVVFWIVVAVFQYFGGDVPDWIAKMHFVTGTFALIGLVFAGALHIYGVVICRNK